MDSQWPSHEPIRPTSTPESAAQISTPENFGTTSTSDLNRGRTIENIQLQFQYDEEKDPRSHHPNYGIGSSRGLKVYRTQFALVHFEFDEYSLGPKPLTTVLLTNLSPLTTEAQIATYLSVYGQVERVEIEKHPATGGSLGIASVGFGGNGQDAARKAVETGNRRRMGLANNVKIEHDPTGDKLKMAVAKTYFDNDDVSTNNESTAKPPPPPSSSSSSSSYDNQAPPHSATYHEEGEIDNRDRDYARWSRRDSYRYQHPKDYIDDRHYYDDRYRDYGNGRSSYSTSSSTAILRSTLPMSSTSASPTRPSKCSSSRYITTHLSYNSRKHSNDRYEPTSRFYGVTPPPPPYSSSSSNSKWDQPSRHLQQHYGLETHSDRNSRSRSRSRSIGRDSSGYYENGSRWDYDARRNSRDGDRDRHRKRSSMWSSHDDRRPEENRSLVTDKLPSLTISRKVLPFIRGVLEELRKVFYHYGSLDIYHDNDNWFVVFDSLSTAKRALTEMDGQSMLGYTLYMILQDPSTPTDLSTSANAQQGPAQQTEPEDMIAPSPAATNSSTITSSSKANNDAASSTVTTTNELSVNNEPTMEADSQLVNGTLCTVSNEDSSPGVTRIDTSNKSSQYGHGNIKNHAKQLLFDQLADVFLKDLKNRVVGPCIYDFLNPGLYKKAAESIDSTTTNKIDSHENATSLHPENPPPSDLPQTSSSLEFNDSETIHANQDVIHTDNNTAHTDTYSTIKTYYSKSTSFGHTTTKNEDDGLFSLPKPEETTNEGPLPSLNKLPRFKKRPKGSSTIKSPNTASASDSFGNRYQHHSYSPKYNDGYGDSTGDTYDDYSSYGYDNNRHTHRRNPVKQEKGKRDFVSSSSRRHSNGTRSSMRSTSNMEEQSGATFFSSSEEGEYQSGASLASSDDQDRDKAITTTTGRKGTGGGTTTMDRKKPRRLRDYLSDEEDEFDQEVHDAFLRQLHQDENGDGNNDNDNDEEDGHSQFVKKGGLADDMTRNTFGRDDFIVDDDGNRNSEFGDDDDDDDDDVYHGTTKRLHKKQRQQHKPRQTCHSSNLKKHRLSSLAVPSWMEDMVDGESGITNGYKRRKKGIPLLQQQAQRSKMNNNGLDLGRPGTRMDVASDSSEDDDMGTGKNHRVQKKTQTEHGPTKPFALDREAYERMLLAPDSSDDDDGAGKQGTLQHMIGDDTTTLQDGSTIDRPDWDPFGQVQDVEDYEFLRLVILEKLGLGVDISDMDNVGKWTNSSDGCARSRGYYVISDAEKATYLPKNQAVLDTSSSSTTTTTASASLNGRLSSSRTNRVNNRRFVVGMVMQKAMADSDILKFNQLKGRKKQLRFAKSPIHDWGLYAEEHIDVNDMVIEYVGEVIRQQVAEERENRYERCGIGSSYLFRVDDDIVIDATKKGSIARFINHCCSPNCSAKIITVDKQKKIVIYANRDIEPGEEITYDYKFPLETDKIPCLCGSKSCKGTLN